MLRELRTSITTLFQPKPRRFLRVWYTVWFALGVKGFVVNGLIRHQPIRIGWVPVTGAAETVYLLAELAVVGAIAWQAWRLKRANWRLAILYEWYSLVEIGVSLLNPSLWTYAMQQMWRTPIGHDTATALASHLLFVACYAFIHHGLPLLVLRRIAHPTAPRPAVA